jgi:hypothetical protein
LVYNLSVSVKQRIFQTALNKGEKMINLYGLVTHRPINADSPKSPECSQTTYQATVHSKEKEPDAPSSRIVLFHGGCIV